jgi:hypothetical protein
MDSDFMKEFQSRLAQIEFGIQETEKNGVSGAAEKIGKAGEAQIREFVNTRGLNRKWAQDYTSSRSGRTRSGSGPSRVDSGQMRDSVTSKVNKSGDLTSVAMGWFNPYSSDAEMPVNYQEYGFELENGEEIPGMNSLEDTLLFIKENIWSLIDKNDIIRFGPDKTRGGAEAPF